MERWSRLASRERKTKWTTTKKKHNTTSAVINISDSRQKERMKRSKTKKKHIQEKKYLRHSSSHQVFWRLFLSIFPIQCYFHTLQGVSGGRAFFSFSTHRHTHTPAKQCENIFLYRARYTSAFFWCMKWGKPGQEVIAKVEGGKTNGANFDVKLCVRFHFVRKASPSFSPSFLPFTHSLSVSLHPRPVVA